MKPTPPPLLVQVESPFAGNVSENEAYARAAMADSLRRGEAPFASHLLYTQLGILDDLQIEERKKGIDAGLAHLRRADKSAIYVDRGLSPGMVLGINAARSFMVPVYFRSLEAPNVELFDDLVPPLAPGAAAAIRQELLALEATWQRVKGSGSKPFSVAEVDNRLPLDRPIARRAESAAHRLISRFRKFWGLE